MTFSREINLELAGLPLRIRSQIEGALADDGTDGGNMRANLQAILSELPGGAKAWVRGDGGGQWRWSDRSRKRGLEAGAQIPFGDRVSVSATGGIEDASRTMNKHKSGFERSRYGGVIDLRLPGKANLKGTRNFYNTDHGWGDVRHDTTSAELGVPLDKNNFIKMLMNKFGNNDPSWGASFHGENFNLSGTNLTDGKRRGFSAHFNLPSNWLPDGVSIGGDASYNPDGYRLGLGGKITW